MIISSNEQLTKHIGKGVISASLESNRILAFVDFGVQKVHKGIGAELLAALEGKRAAGTLEGEPLGLFDKVERAVAWYAYAKYLPFSSGTDGDNGLQETSTEGTQPTRISILDKRQKAADENAAEAFEALMIYLFANTAKFPEWAASKAFGEYNSLIVRNGTELGMALPSSKGEYRTFVTLVGWIREEQEELGKYTGPTLLAGILEKLKDGILMDSEVWWNAWKFCARYVCRKAFSTALPELLVVQTGNGLRVLSEFDGINNFKSPNSGDYALLQGSLGDKADEAFNDMIAYLSLHADELPEFKTEGAFKLPTAPRFLNKYETLLGL